MTARVWCVFGQHHHVRKAFLNADTWAEEQSWWECKRCGKWLGHDDTRQVKQKPADLVGCGAKAPSAAADDATPCPVEAFIAFYEGSGLTNMRPDAARAELARLRAVEDEYEAVIQNKDSQAATYISDEGYGAEHLHG